MHAAHRGGARPPWRRAREDAARRSASASAGPVAGGRQYISWIALDDLAGLYLAALDDDRFDGAFNATAPTPVRNAEFSRALGRALHRPALAPVPALALRLLYGSMAQIVTASQNAVPARALALGHTFAHPALADALTEALR